MLRKIIPLFALCLIVQSAEATNQPENSAQVMLFGTFHFDDPGLDQVKSKKIDVLLPTNQAILKDLVTRISDNFKPTHILLECSKERENELNEEFRNFVTDNFTLQRNEVYQIGFRLARMRGLTRIYCFDEQEVHWQGTQLIEHMKQYGKSVYADIQSLIQTVSASSEKKHATMDLLAILKDTNSHTEDTVNKSFYLLSNGVGAFDNYVGADATASWWHRNFRMYANVQHVAQPDTRVFVLAGQGHTAILKDLLAMDVKRKKVSMSAYFE